MTASTGESETGSRSDQAIRAVIWDGGGVLVRTVDGTPRRLWETRLGLPRGGLEPLVFQNEVARAAAVGRGGWEDVWAWVGARFRLSNEDLAALQRDFFSGDRLDEELVGFVRRLRPRLLTAMLTNAFRSARHDLQDHWKVADAFDQIIISAEEGAVKPDPRIYTIALARLGLAPSQALFIDDVEENVEGARRVGMQALRFASTAQAMEAVRVAIGD